MRVAHVITGLGTGGAEIMLAKLAERWATDGGPETTVLSLTGEDPVGARLRAAGARVDSLGIRGIVNGTTGLATLRRRLREEKPDLVQGWLYHGNLAALAAPRGTPVLWNIRSTVVERHDSLAGRLGFDLSRRLSHRPDIVVYNSEAGRLEHERAGYRSRRTVILPNGFDTDTMRPNSHARDSFREEVGIPASAPVVGMVARNHPQKDYLTFLLAAIQIAREMPQTHFLAVGRDVDTDVKLAAVASSPALDGRVHRLGERRDVARVYAAMDVFGLSSAWGEGFPNVVGDAMSCGVPCVVTTSGAAPEIVGETGMVVPPRNPRALAEAILHFLRLSSTERTKRGELARLRIAQRYHIRDVAAQYHRLYDEVVR